LIIGIGIDLVEVERVRALLEQHPVRGPARLYTDDEVAYCRASRSPAESFAARFAAKEAVFKAFGTGWSGGLSWTEIEVVVDENGAPCVRLHGEASRLALSRSVLRTHLSLTHTRGFAGAFVVLEGAPPSDAPAAPAP